MENIKEINKITNKLFNKTNDNIVGVSYGHNVVNGKRTKDRVLSFKVKKKLPKEELSDEDFIAPIITISGKTFNTDVVEEDIGLLMDFCDPDHYQWWEEMGNIPPDNRNFYRPLRGGISVTNYTSKFSTTGTLGFFAIDNQDDSIVGVSNNHVLVDDAFIAGERTNEDIITNVSGDYVTQPHEQYNYGLTNMMGIVKRYVPIKTTSGNLVDGALTTIDQGSFDLINSWKQVGLENELGLVYEFATSDEIDNIINDVKEPLLYSAGRTSGAKGHLFTKLLCDGIGTYNIAYKKQGQFNYAKFNEVIEFVAVPSGTTVTSGDTCYFPLASGDSGSALIADIEGTFKIIGLCFAGAMKQIPYNGETVTVSTRGLACRIDRVAEELNIRQWNGSETLKYSDRNNIKKLVIEGLSNQKTYYDDVNDKTYWQVGLTTSTPDIYPIFTINKTDLSIDSKTVTIDKK